MLIRIALLLVSLPLLAHGGEGLYVAARSRTQAQLTCAQYFQQRPRSGWVRLSGCEVDYIRAGYREARGRITELFFPLRPTGTSPAVPAVVVLATRDPEVLGIAERTIGGGTSTDQDSFLVMMLQIVTAMRVSKEVDGFVRPPLETLRTRTSLSAIRAPLDEHFVILDLHARPVLLYPAIEVATGALALLLFAFLSVRLRRKKRADALIPEAQAPETVEAGDAASMADRPAGAIRGVMLLNLPATATVADIETAPPLGSQAQVRDRLSSVLPGVTFDEFGRGSYNRPDVAVSIDLAKKWVVHTAVLDLEGEAAERTLQKLLATTGWRAFSPKRWTFL